MKIEINYNLDIEVLPVPIKYNGVEVGKITEFKNNLYIGEIEDKYKYLFPNGKWDIGFRIVDLKGEKE